MLVPEANIPIALERASRSGGRNEGLTTTVPGDRATGGGVVARPLEGSFSHAADARTLLAAQVAREDPTGRQGPESDPRELSQTEELEVRRMARRGAEVRRHELAHAAAGGPHIGIAEYKYERGPDGKLYAVGGRVSIDVAPASTPQATIRKMDTIIRAAMAPLNPSIEDRAAAVLAWHIRQRAINEAQAEKTDAGEDSPHTPAVTPAANSAANSADDERAAGQSPDPRQAFDLSN